MKSESLKKVLSLGLGLAALGSLVFMTAGQAAQGTNQPIGKPNFKVEIDGVMVGGVHSVSGIGAETDVVEYQDGDDMTMHKRPGRTKYANITLSRDFAQNGDLWKWYQEVVSGKNIRKNITITMYKKDGSEAGRYNFFEGWPCRWQGPTMGDPDFDLKTKGVVHGDPDFDLLTEKIGFCVNGMDRK